MEQQGIAHEPTSSSLQTSISKISDASVKSAASLDDGAGRASAEPPLELPGVCLCPTRHAGLSFPIGMPDQASPGVRPRCAACSQYVIPLTPRRKTAIDKILGWFSFSDLEDDEQPMIADVEMEFIAQRPPNVTPKSQEEIEKHLKEYYEIQENFHKRLEQDAREIAALRRKKRAMEKARQEQNDLWLSQILPSWEKKRSTAAVVSMWRQGLPPRIRGVVWPLAIGNQLQITRELFTIFGQHARQARKEVASSLEKELEYAAEFAADETTAVSKPGPALRVVGKEGTIRFIEFDLARTFPTLAKFHDTGSFYDELRSVLESYVFYRPDVGYVQGMSYLAAMLLLYMDSYTAFVCLANMLNQHYFLSFFRLDVAELQKHFKVYEVLFAEQMPNLYKRFQEFNINSDMYLMEWFLTLFSKSLPIAIASRIWDNYFLEGEMFMFRAALGILWINADRFLRPSATFEDAMAFITHLPEDIDEGKLFAAIDQITVPSYVFHLLDRLRSG
eukprot:tig00000525_g1944.t1